MYSIWPPGQWPQIQVRVSELECAVQAGALQPGAQRRSALFWGGLYQEFGGCSGSVVGGGGGSSDAAARRACCSSGQPATDSAEGVEPSPVQPGASGGSDSI